MRVIVSSPKMDVTIGDAEGNLIMDWHVTEYILNVDIHALLADCGSLAVLCQRIQQEFMQACK